MPKRGTEVAVSKGKVERMPRAMGGFGGIDRLFDDFFARRWPRAFDWDRPFGELADFGPSVDVIDRDDEVLVRAEVPGFKKEDIEVAVAGNLLTLSGQAGSEDSEEKGSYYRAEISRSAFTRTLPLPAEVDDAKARASMKDGVLELTLPKVEKSRRRTITIS
jgi:HSP20 family protein